MVFQIVPIDEAKGVIWTQNSTNEALAKRDYSEPCAISSEPIIVFQGYFIWWCQTHHQPWHKCEIDKERVK